MRDTRWTYEDAQVVLAAAFTEHYRTPSWCGCIEILPEPYEEYGHQLVIDCPGGVKAQIVAVPCKGSRTHFWNSHSEDTPAVVIVVLSTDTSGAIRNKVFSELGRLVRK